MQPELSFVNPCMWVQHHRSELSTGFQLKPGTNTKLLSFVFSVSVITPYHLFFLTFFIHTTHLGHCALLTPLASVLSRDLWKKIFFCLWPHCLELSTFTSHKTQCFSTFKRKLKTHLLEKHLSWCLQVSTSVYVVQLVRARARSCVCTCACVQVSVRACEHSLACLLVCVCACVRACVRARARVYVCDM